MEKIEQLENTIDINKVMEITGYSRPTIEKYIKNGSLKAFKAKEGRAVRVTIKSVEDFFNVIKPIN